MSTDREALVRLLAEEPLRIRGADFQSEHRPVTDYIDKLQGALRSIILAAQGGGQPPDRETRVKRLQHASTVLKVSPRAADLQAVSYIIDDAIAALSAQRGEQRIDLIDPMRFLVELKHIKRRIEAGTATESEAAFYEANKETAWLNAERALSAAKEVK